MPAKKTLFRRALQNANKMDPKDVRYVLGIDFGKTITRKTSAFVCVNRDTRRVVGHRLVSMEREFCARTGRRTTPTTAELQQLLVQTLLGSYEWRRDLLPEHETMVLLETQNHRCLQLVGQQHALVGQFLSERRPHLCFNAEAVKIHFGFDKKSVAADPKRRHLAESNKLYPFQKAMSGHVARKQARLHGDHLWWTVLKEVRDNKDRDVKDDDYGDAYLTALYACDTLDELVKKVNKKK